MIWCCGMYSSGSTWVYNAARAVGVACGVPVEAVYADAYRTVAGLRNPDVTYVVKTHDLDARATAVMAARAKRILISIRDPRDCLASIRAHMGVAFPMAAKMVDHSARYTAMFSRDPRTILLRYEDGYIDDPVTLDRFADAFGGTLSAAQRATLFQGSRREAIEARIAAFERLASVTMADARSGDVVDLDTQWHRHHAHRTGEVGRWRRDLPPDMAAAIAERLGAWMGAFGYF